MTRASTWGRSTRWSLFGMMFALVLVASAVSAQETEEEKCSDFTPDNRPCTVTEELDYCIRNAVEAYEDCKEDQPWYNKVACSGLYYIDFWACGAELPLNLLK